MINFIYDLPFEVQLLLALVVPFLGSMLIFCVGVNLAFGQKFRVANMLPSLVFGALFTAFLA